MERAVDGGGAGRLSRAKIMSIKKGSPALMVNVNKGREGVNLVEILMTYYMNVP